jgi:putative glycosyltransferase (TIGR04348 family)
MRAARPAICIITPTLRASNSGNWHTAARWARFLRPDYRVQVLQSWSGEACDALIALHARKSADSVSAFHAAYPQRGLALVLTGTDLYRDIRHSRMAQRSLQLAHELVVLQERGTLSLPAEFRRKTRVVFQSAEQLRAARPKRDRFDVAVVGHLRSEKDPLLAMRVAAALSPQLRGRVLHAGAALDEQLAAAARRTAARTPQYRWLGETTRGRARALMRDSALLLHPSRIEGGAQAIIEAIRSGTPVIASKAEGNVGLLGSDYPALFAVGDTEHAVRLIERAATDPAFMRALALHCRRRAKLFAPERERAAVRRLVRDLLHNQSDRRARSKR